MGLNFNHQGNLHSTETAESVELRLPETNVLQSLKKKLRQDIVRQLRLNTKPHGLPLQITPMPLYSL